MRRSGILLPVSALPSPYGVGTFGRAAYEFCDFLAAAGQRIWQVLPLGPTSYGDSPYQSFSTFAGNPYFIDLDLLEQEGLLDKSDYISLPWGGDTGRVDYAGLYFLRFDVLGKAWDTYRAGDTAELDAFCAEQDAWLPDYALFMALKGHFGGLSWQMWPAGYKRRDPDVLARAAAELAWEIGFYSFLQFQFFKQWRSLKAYANGLGISILGDLPIYVAPDSADIWSAPELFDLNEDLSQRTLAGCPPDPFSLDGQLWGNPVYRWDVMAQGGYAWWIARLHAAVTLYDMVRLDHFIGFSRCWAVPAGSETAALGDWQAGPGLAFFQAAEAALGKLPFVAEDLGQLTPQVRALLADSGYPGMKMLEFAFGEPDSEYMPHNYPRHCVVYAGTHDNTPIAGWFDDLPGHERARCAAYLGLEGEVTGADVVWPLLRLMQGSVADTAVVQMQDALELGADARTNIPGTPSGNWTWRMEQGALTPPLAARLRELAELYGRV